MSFIKPMLPTLTFSPPESGEWCLEVKYDGFRGILEWNESSLHLWSRNGKDLLPLFPEIAEFLEKRKEAFAPFIPIKLDGEVTALQNPFKSNFQKVQQRGRIRSREKATLEARKWPCQFLVFDCLLLEGKELANKPFWKRKNLLKEIFSKLLLPLTPDHAKNEKLQLVPFYLERDEILQLVTTYEAEGVIFKSNSSLWHEGRRTVDWLKFKNLKTASCFVTAFDKANGYFHVGVKHGSKEVPIGQFLFNLDQRTKAALAAVAEQNKIAQKGSLLSVPPGICLEVQYLQWIGDGLREPHFKKLLLDQGPEDCTYEDFLLQEAALPANVSITHSNKILWEKDMIVTKLDYLRYLRKVSPLMLPFLKDRALTVIRAPHGIYGESFYQKNKPDYVPGFVDAYDAGDVNYIVCNNLETLIWLGNQLAIEFHIPFQTVRSPYVSEIVFDLDPPDRTMFQSAVYAASLLKKILDEFRLVSFVKISGNKGIQVYIPLPLGIYTWKDTRKFTSFIADFLVRYDPDSFTIERLKKNRNGRLYVDFVQHAEGKTIIAPYSVRQHEEALVACPILWEELNTELSPLQFTMQAVLDRLEDIRDPFAQFDICRQDQPFAEALRLLEGSS